MRNTIGRRHVRGVRLSAIAAAMAMAYSGGAAALEFTIADTTIRLDNLVTIGGTWRMQDRDSSLIGKSSLTPGICTARAGDDGVSGPGANPSYAAGPGRISNNTCNPNEDDKTGTYDNANTFFVNQPGSYSPNGDNGNLNFDKHDLVQATAKITSDLNFDLFGFNIFARSLAYYDAVYADLDETHPDTTLQAGRTRYPGSARNANGANIQMLDYFISRTFDIGERAVSLKVGNQVLNWGESGFLALNSLNSINAPNQVLLRFPGSDIKEVFQPQGMVTLNVDVASGVGLELFYQYEWKPIIIDPVGSFYSSSDTLGDGGTYAMLSFSKAPEDPLGLYQPYRNPDDPAAILGSTSSRTAQRDLEWESQHQTEDGGQYGAALKFFVEGLNNGTEFGLYFANYHSRVPSVSVLASDATCIGRGAIPGLPLIGQIAGLLPGPLGSVPGLVANLAQVVADCGVPLTNLGAAVGIGDFSPASREGLPLGSIRLVAEYPEDIRMWGVSFNTSLGDWAWSGEYAYRENLPIQIHTTDLIYAGLQPAFPANDFSLAPIAVLPGRRTAVPDFVSQYRGIEIGAGDYIRGYERMKVGQLGTTFLKMIGGNNPLGATQITVLLEMGLTHVIDMPGLDELQFNGAGTDTHISSGADGSIGINPRDTRSDPNDPYSNRAAESADTIGLMQNPTAHADLDGFGTDVSYGYRFVTLTRYDDAFMGINIELLNALFHDVKGTAPGLGQNFVEGRKQILSGIRWDYLSKYTGEIRYTWHTGGGNRDQNRDRDNLLVYLGYLF
jgi:hypothetical protein